MSDSRTSRLEGRCPAQTWITRGHRYQARFDISGCKSLDAVFGSMEADYTGAISHLLEKTRSKTYVRDVCTRCGNTIERLSSSEAALIAPGNV